MTIRVSAVAGLFYPGQPEPLRELVTQMLEQAVLSEVGYPDPRALVVPHAGLVYSGPVAACAYKLLAQRAAEAHWQRVVILGPNHRMPLQGMAVAQENYWQTPLGEIAVDQDYIARLLQRFDIAQRSDVHQLEHCLEVQLPFLQTVLPNAELVPVLVGPTAAEEVAELIRYLWRQPDTLVLISSDLSHYHSWSEANRLDAITSQMILARESWVEPEQACGCYALNGLLLAALEEGYQVAQLCHANSGDTAGDKTRVVGYGSYLVY